MTTQPVLDRSSTIVRAPSATFTHMASVAVRDLRNHTRDVLRRVADGEPVTVTQHGRPVAEIRPVTSARPGFLSRAELVDLLGSAQADPGLRDDLAILAGETTDDLGPIA